jgi:ATP-binding cassette, subfamily B, bacterial MsbA
MKAIFLRLMAYVRPHRWMVIVSIVMGLVVSGCTGAIAYAIRPLLDDVFIKKDTVTLMWLPWAVLAAVFFKGVAGYAQAVLMQILGQTVLMDIRNALYRALVHLPVGRFTRTASGDYVSRVINDVNVLQRVVSDVVKDVVKNSVTVVVLIGVIFYQDWLLALVAVAVLPPAMYPLNRLGRLMRKRSRLGQEAISSLTRVLTETLGGIRVVKGFVAEEREARRFTTVNRTYLRYMKKLLRTVEIAAPLMEFIGALGIVGIIALGGGRVISGETTPGAFFSFAAACMMVYRPARVLAGANAITQQSLAAAQRIFEVMDMQPEGEPPGTELPDLTEVRETIAFDHVSHAYEGGDGPAVEDISFVARVGEMVALVGPSGAGKTTVANLIARFIDPTAGAIRVDGRDLREYSLKSLRRMVGIVAQDTVLFDATVAENIAYGAGEREVTPEEIAAAAVKAHADDFIRAMPEGYDTPVGERGVLLSGGQRQRIAIARAVLKDAPILVLDEATSALDSESERHVQAALAALMAGRTTIVIAHRLATVRFADRILVMDSGRVVERGTHDELLGVGGLYRKLYDLQFQPTVEGTARR